MTNTTRPARPMTNRCQATIDDEATGYDCTLTHAHAGDHNWVDGMGLNFIDEQGIAHYRPGWNYAR